MVFVADDDAIVVAADIRQDLNLRACTTFRRVSEILATFRQPLAFQAELAIII